MKVLVAGAGGFLGRAVVEVLAEEHTLRLFDVRPVQTPHECVVGDAADFGAARTALHESTYEGGAGPAFDANVRGLYALLEAAQQLGIPNVVHMSTGAIYGPLAPGERYTLDTPARPGSPYALTKALQEEVCRYFADAHALAITMFRPWSIMDRHTGVTKYGTSAGGNWGNIDRYDIGRAIALALARPVPGLRAYFLAGTPEARRLMEWEPLDRDLGWRPSTIAEPQPVAVA